MSDLAIQTGEWARLTPETHAALAGRALASGHRDVARELSESGRLEVLELACGLEIRTTSWVGRINLGEVSITISSKITGAPLLELLRYAYGLRDLSLYADVAYAPSQATFQDLLVHQLAAEVSELLSRGLHRDYKARREDLSSPAGRIDFGAYPRIAAEAKSVLPSIHYPRTEATLMNQVLLGGLRLGAQLANDPALRSRSRRLAQFLEATVPPLALGLRDVERVRQIMDRRHRAYEPSLNIIELLLEGSGVSLEQASSRITLASFLFDMNRFFQGLLSRFLREHLPNHTVRDEYRLHEMFAYDDSANPHRRKAPTPRPDFVVFEGKRVVAVLDAKYRDLWNQALPREMLYQLALYALGHRAKARQATILYPSLADSAREQIVQLRDPLKGSLEAKVVLRPVNLLDLAGAVARCQTEVGQEQCRRLAAALAFGSVPAPMSFTLPPLPRS
ncbi:McrC family protein [Microvirga massiliensis]|uniref:McrC family protein n=1 Tax=Microvirga massiliensis TaxID=1033741 RepID=UPI00066101F9|nr:hypothetical protein [Microvirga massiliensis]